MAFFQKVRFVFQISQSPKKIIPTKLSWAWNLKFLPISVNNLFKFQAQDSFFGRLGDLKNESHFLKKGTLSKVADHFINKKRAQKTKLFQMLEFSSSSVVLKPGSWYFSGVSSSVSQLSVTLSLISYPDKLISEHRTKV